MCGCADLCRLICCLRQGSHPARVVFSGFWNMPTEGSVPPGFIMKCFLRPFTYECFFSKEYVSSASAVGCLETKGPTKAPAGLMSTYKIDTCE